MKITSQNPEWSKYVIVDEVGKVVDNIQSFNDETKEVEIFDEQTQKIQKIIMEKIRLVSAIERRDLTPEEWASLKSYRGY